MEELISKVAETKITETTDEAKPETVDINDKDRDISNDPIFAAKDHDKEFDPSQYLEGFYKTHQEDTAMQVVLFFLPGMWYRLPEKINTLLDLGAGPTVYIPISVRKRAENIFTSDYAEANRNVLQSWMENSAVFDWTNVCKWISTLEGSDEPPAMMQNLARSKMRAVLHVDVHHKSAIRAVHARASNFEGDVPKQFDVVTTVFCLEYASETLQEYESAVHSATALIKPGGHLVQGGVLNADEYSFGGKRFRCHHLTKPQLLETLCKNGMSTTEKSKDFHLIIHDDIFILVSKKIA